MDIMIDLETFSLRPDGAILQVAAVEFEPVTGGNVRVDRMFNAYVRPHLGTRAVDLDTVLWWMEQDREALARLRAGVVAGAHLGAVLTRLEQWFQQEGRRESRVWSHGAGFYLPMLRHAFQAAGMKVPWSHRLERDTRTLYWTRDWDAAREAKAKRRAEERVLGRPLLKHDAADDAALQACTVQEAVL